MSLPVSVTSSKSSTVSYEYDFRGNRTKMTDSTGVTAFSYSPLSELVSETHGDISKSYSYDKNSPRTVFTLSKGGSNGEVKFESFDDNLYIGVSKSSGEQGLNEIAYQYTHPGKYNLATHNCDHLTSIVAAAAGLFYDKRILPNDSFIYTKMYYTNYEVWKLNQAIRNWRILK